MLGTSRPAVVEIELPFIVVNAVWHARGVLQTLHPVPDHPSSQEHPAAVRFAREFDAGANCRPAPWKRLPPQAGCAQLDPPKPGGHAQDEPFVVRR